LTGGEAVLTRDDQVNLFSMIRGNSGVDNKSVVMNLTINGSVDKSTYRDLQYDLKKFGETFRKAANSGYIPFRDVASMRMA